MGPLPHLRERREKAPFEPGRGKESRPTLGERKTGPAHPYIGEEEPAASRRPKKGSRGIPSEQGIIIEKSRERI